MDIGVRNPQKVYEVLKDGIIGKITMKSTGDESSITAESDIGVVSK
jgi:hypothetical protein